MSLFRQAAQLEADAARIRERAEQAQHATATDRVEADQKAQELEAEAALMYQASGR